MTLIQLLTLVSFAFCDALQLINATTFGGGIQTLQYNESLVWGPLDVPARVTRIGLRLVNTTGISVAFPTFDLWLLNETAFANYTQGLPFDTLNNGILTARMVNSVGNVTELVVGGDAKTFGSRVFLVIDHTPLVPSNGFHAAAPPGSSITIAWLDFQWLTGDKGVGVGTVAASAECAFACSPHTERAVWSTRRQLWC